MKSSGAGDKHINNNLKTVLSFVNFSNHVLSFEDIKRKEVVQFLESKIKSIERDPDRKWITTWNVYLNHLKYFFRWFYNEYSKPDESNSEPEYKSQIDWITPEFMKIKRKKTKRLSPYIESELWSKDELLLVIKYEQFKRNKAALSLLWDLDARNHEVTLLKIKHLRLKEKYGASFYHVIYHQNQKSSASHKKRIINKILYWDFSYNKFLLANLHIRNKYSIL
jgi:hypothetical protein